VVREREARIGNLLTKNQAKEKAAQQANKRSVRLLAAEQAAKLQSKRQGSQKCIGTEIPNSEI